MKKESVLLVILVFVFVVVKPSLISIGEMKERAKVGVVFKALDSKWWKTMEKGIEIVAVQPANSDRYLGMQVTENILTSNPDLNGVFETADQMTLGALEALKSAKKEKRSF